MTIDVKQIRCSLVFVVLMILCFGGDTASAGEGSIYLSATVSRFANLVSLSTTDDPYADETVLGEGEWKPGAEIRYRKSTWNDPIIQEYYASLYQIGDNFSFTCALSVLPRNTILFLGLPIPAKNAYGADWMFYIAGLDAGLGFFTTENEISNSIENTLTIDKSTSIGLIASQNLFILRHKHFCANLLKLEYFFTFDGVGGAGITSSLGIGF